MALAKRIAGLLKREAQVPATVVTPAPHVSAEPVRVIETIATDFVWSEKHRGFFPVFGSVHGDRAGAGLPLPAKGGNSGPDVLDTTCDPTALPAGETPRRLR